MSGASENRAHLLKIATGNTTYVTLAESVVSIVGMDTHASVILTAVGDSPRVMAINSQLVCVHLNEKIHFSC
jgi:hypothetical protein